MNIKYEKKPIDFLERDFAGSLTGLIHKTQQLQQLNHAWKSCIDPTLAEHTQVANLRNGCLIIEVESSAWATRLRFAIPEIQKRLQTSSELRNLKNIEWYIQPAENTTRPIKQHAPLQLSENNAQLIEDTAAHITNKKLRDVLQQLAKHKKLT